VTARDALNRLMQGARRFASDGIGPPTTGGPRLRLASLATAQHPFAAVLGCADSRVPPEVIFDQRLGDLFVVRVAGAFVDQHVLGSLDYAITRLRVPLIVVLGHEDCGAITAALEPATTRHAQSPDLRALLEAIDPALASLDRAIEPRALLTNAVEASVRSSVCRIQRADCVSRANAPDELLVVGAVVELHTGRVRLLDEVKTQTARARRSETAPPRSST